jgi:hypothetical protein
MNGYSPNGVNLSVEADYAVHVVPADVRSMFLRFEETKAYGSMPQVAEVVCISTLVSNGPFHSGMLRDDMGIGYSKVKVAVFCYPGHFIGVDGNQFLSLARSHSNLDLWEHH